MEYHVFKKHLSPEAVAEVNKGGWSSLPECKAYADLFFIGDVEEAETKLLHAMIHGVFGHAAAYKIEDAEVTDGLEMIFKYENDKAVPSVELLFRRGSPFSSLSVGDIVHVSMPEGSKMFLCAPIGFEELGEDFGHAFDKLCHFTPYL